MVLASMRDETPVSFLTWKEQWTRLVSSTFHTCCHWVLGGDALGGPTSWAMLRTGNRGQTLWYTNNHNYIKIIILLKCCIMRSTVINIFLEFKKKKILTTTLQGFYSYHHLMLRKRCWNQGQLEIFHYDMREDWPWIYLRERHIFFGRP